MGRLIRLDRSGHTTVAEWTPGDAAEAERATMLFADELERGLIASVEPAAAQPRSCASCRSTRSWSSCADRSRAAELSEAESL